MSEFYIASHLTKEYSGVQVLHEVDFKIETGKIHGLFGHNGAGKSTLLKILAGVEQPTLGSLELMGESRKLLSPYDALNHGVACVYQELRLIDDLTVVQNIFLGREFSWHGHLDERAMYTYTKHLLEEYGVEIDPGSYIKDISHPLKQIVEVITNLDRNAKFVFLDEPTTALEHRQADDLLSRVHQIVQDRQIGIVIVSHKIDEVLPYCNDVTVLSEGKKVFESLGKGFSKKEITDAIIGKKSSMESHELPPPIKQGRPMLEVQNLKTKKLDGITMTVYAGEIFGIYGLVGSGRTSFAQTLYGMHEITGGTVKVAGLPYLPKDNFDAIRNGVAYLTEDRKRSGIIPEMSGLANANLTSFHRYTNGVYLNLERAEASVHETLNGMQIKGDVAGPIKSLSGGNQQKVLIARIIRQNADVIILDEPTKGVDLGAKGDIYHIIDTLARSGRCVIIISGEEEELIRTCSRVTVFHHSHCSGETLTGTEITVSTLREAVC